MHLLIPLTKLTLKSSSQKYKPQYKLKVAYEAPSGKKWENKEVEGSFTQWFNTYGYLQKKELQAWLAQNIEVLGVAQSEGKTQTNVGGTSKTTTTTATAAIDDDTLAAISGPETMSFSSATETTSSTVPPSAKKARGKKKT
jgi:hypothetical protein